MKNDEPYDPLLRLLIENAREYAAFLIDAQGNIASWNVGAERLFGYPAGEAKSSAFSSLFPPESAARGDEIRREADGQGFSRGEALLRRQDGAVFPALVVVAARRNQSERLNGYSVLVRDLSGDPASDSRRDLEQFASIASHDLQEPLRTVSMYADLLLARSKEKLTDQEKDFLRYTVEGADRAQKLVRALTEYARAGAKTKNFKPVDMNQVLKKTLAGLQPAIDGAGAEIKTAPLPAVEADGLQMAQLFRILLSNAIQYRGTAPLRIEISAAEKDGQWHFCVKDNGPGIAPEHQEKIFGIFQRLSPEKSKASTGMGLAIGRKIMERHGGRLWVESAEGRGAEFWFSIPAKKVS